MSVIAASQWAGGSDKPSKQILRGRRSDCVTAHSLVLCTSSVATSDTGNMSLVLLAVRNSHFTETDWSCASRETLRIRWPPDARLMNESICEPAFKLQDAERSRSRPLRRTQPRPAGRADCLRVVYCYKCASCSSFKLQNAIN